MSAVLPSDFDVYGLTVDIDWSPDFWIDEMAEVLSAAGVPCTWYITHDSPAIRRLRSNPLFECGIHPNFFPGSSHGREEEEIIRHCLQIVPDADSVRMHALYQSSRLLWRLYEDFDFRVDSSLFTPHASALVPHHLVFSRSGKCLVRIPYGWEDDVECLTGETGWAPTAAAFHPEGLKVFNFHPVYVGLNCHTLDGYEALKVAIRGRKSLEQVSREETEEYVHGGEGAGTCFRRLVELIAERGYTALTQREIGLRYRQLARISV